MNLSLINDLLFSSNNYKKIYKLSDFAKIFRIWFKVASKIEQVQTKCHRNEHTHVLITHKYNMYVCSIVGPPEYNLYVCLFK